MGCRIRLSGEGALGGAVVASLVLMKIPVSTLRGGSDPRNAFGPKMRGGALATQPKRLANAPELSLPGSPDLQKDELVNENLYHMEACDRCHWSIQTKDSSIQPNRAAGAAGTVVRSCDGCEVRCVPLNGLCRPRRSGPIQQFGVQKLQIDIMRTILM